MTSPTVSLYGQIYYCKYITSLQWVYNDHWTWQLIPNCMSKNIQTSFLMWKTIACGGLLYCCCCCVASVVSDSVWPHKRKPSRLPCPWDSPGKNTGVGCHCLLQCIKVKSESEVAQLCPTPSDPMDCSLPGSSIHGIFQARVLEWGAIAFSGLTLQDIQISIKAIIK